MPSSSTRRRPAWSCSSARCRIFCFHSKPFPIQLGKCNRDLKLCGTCTLAQASLLAPGTVAASGIGMWPALHTYLLQASRSDTQRWTAWVDKLGNLVTHRNAALVRFRCHFIVFVSPAPAVRRFPRTTLILPAHAHLPRAQLSSTTDTLALCDCVPRFAGPIFQPALRGVASELLACRRAAHGLVVALRL